MRHRPHQVSTCIRECGLILKIGQTPLFRSGRLRAGSLQLQDETENFTRGF